MVQPATNLLFPGEAVRRTAELIGDIRLSLPGILFESSVVAASNQVLQASLADRVDDLVAVLVHPTKEHMERCNAVEAVTTKEVETQDANHKTGAHVPLAPGGLDGDMEEGGHHLQHRVHQPRHQQPVTAR